MGTKQHLGAAIVFTVALALGSAPAIARGGHSGGTHHSSSGHHSGGGHPSGSGSSAKGSHSSGKHAVDGGSRAAPGVTRDSHGKIARSGKAKDEFKKAHSCPSTGRTSGACPGYVIDHVQALKHGGADSPTNMQWQTKADAKAKDRLE